MNAETRAEAAEAISRQENYPPSAIAAENALHLIVPVIAAPFAAFASIVKVPPAPDVVKLTFPEPTTELPLPEFIVLTMYPLLPVLS